MTEPTQTQTTLPPTVQAEAFLYLCSAVSDKEESVQLELNQTYPLKICLKFHDITGLTEAQKEQRHQALSEAQAQRWQEITGQEGLNMARAGLLRCENYIVEKIRLNSIQLKLDNIENVRQIRVENTSRFGMIDVYLGEEGLLHDRKNLIIEKNLIRENMAFFWDYDNLTDYFAEHPTPSPRDFQDTFHFTVEYEDGTKAIASVDILFNAAGEATVFCSRYEKIAA